MRKNRKKQFWILNQKWTRRFMISHILGWITATLQTAWIVWEVRRAAKELKRK